MKKIFFSIVAVAAALASCTKFEYDSPIDFQEAETPVVTAAALSDSTIHVTVLPKPSTSFYSYIVAEGRAAQLDSVSLLKGGYEGGLASAVVEYGSQSNVVLNIGDLTPNTYYTVYAVANNAQGKVSSVATATCLTTDGTAPVIQDFDYAEEDSVLAFAIKFDDPVAKGTGKVTAHYFAAFGGSDAEGNLTEQKSYDVPADSVFASGNLIYVFLPKEEYIPGAYVTLSYTEGTAVNALGEKCAAFDETAVFYDSSSKDYDSYGILGQYDNVSFALSLNPEGDAGDDDDFSGADDDEDEAGYEVFTDWKTLIMKSYAQTAYPLAGRKKTTALISTVDGNGRTVSYTGEQLYILDKANGIVGVAIDEDPGFGTYVSYTVAAGSILDIYGNANSEFSVTKGYLCSFGYTIDDIIGTYTVKGTSYWSGSDETETWVIEKSDNAEKGNVMITTYWGRKCDYPIYASFDGDSGELRIPDYQIFQKLSLKTGEKVGDFYFACNTNEEGAVLTIKVPSAGTLADIDLAFGYYCEAEGAYAATHGGWWNLFTSISGKRQ